VERASVSVLVEVPELTVEGQEATGLTGRS